MLSQRTDAVNPIHILRRGYSIALHEGRAIKDPALLKQGDGIDIIMADGKLFAEVKKKYEQVVGCWLVCAILPTTSNKTTR